MATAMTQILPTGRSGAATGFGCRRPGMVARTLWRVADSRRLSPRHRARFRLLLSRLAPGPFDIEAEDIRLRAYPADNHSDRVAMARGRLPDRDERAAIAPFLQRGGTFVDVGANIGLYALWAARRLGPSGRVIAIEPHPGTADRLAFNIAANGLANIRIVRAAAGAAEGTAALHASAGGNVGQSSLIEDVAFRPEGHFEVSVRPLLDILADAAVSAIDVLKVDIEGYEDRALVPFLRAVPDALLPRAVLVETDVSERWETDCLAALAARGYEPLTKTAANTVLTRERV
ncbi:FkbM family methyltransferase [Microbaculum sp. FT89]|uniref:FkbM family methyltransferase n=1 Tax=Microbaculum sp. FT89 TaxID=3447298 RepID=UPI003F53B669